MRLITLLKDVETKTTYTFNPEITCVTDNTDKILKGAAFVCITGNHVDGNEFAHLALSKGASVIVSEKELDVENCIVVNDSRAAYALMCGNFYKNAHKMLKMIGITGTNGKTSTSLLLKAVLENQGFKVGLMGTLKVIAGEESFPADLTTPDPADLHRYIEGMLKSGCDTCIMEVSSQALAQKRVYGICFSCGIFTNISPEHLDYHGTMESYASAKSELFENSQRAVINGDDMYAELMKSKCQRCVEYGKTVKNNTISDIALSDAGVSFNFTSGAQNYPVRLNMTGEFSAYNLAAVLTYVQLNGLDICKAVDTISSFNGIPGRMEKVKNDFGINIIIDFAHTPDSLERVLKTLRKIYNGRLITVFGCGGNRDKSKRPVMGRIACDLSDKVFITSDNPRNENPEEIINEIISGTEKTNYYRITDRTLALKSALLCAKSGDTVLVAGKGHEKYQVSGTQKIYYNEREIIRKVLEDKARY